MKKRWLEKIQKITILVTIGKEYLMKLVLLTAGIRAGADFFHSLLDGHSQILQFPGYLRVDKNLRLILETKDYKKKAELFVEYYPDFFNSKKNKLERWDKLGNNKKQYFKVDRKNFVTNFYKLSIKNKKSISNYQCLVNLHLAYYVTRKKNIKNLKILFIHTHLLSWTKEFVKLFDTKKVYILHTIRHPLSSLSSSIKSWLGFENGKHFFSKDLFYHINTVVNCIYKLNKLGKLHVVRLERLHTQNTDFIKKFCKKFQINYESSLKRSTKNDLKWWGDKVSQKYIYGINKHFKAKIFEKHFYIRDLIFIQNLTEKIIKKYNYDFYYDENNISINLLPMKCEIDVWKNTMKNIFEGGFRWKNLFSIPVFYILRILLINKLQIISRSGILPREI